ncbi:MAG: hypothetical protein Lokiarch_18030, partial [Candidatus Lokiarchaeum sp. GC14_75]
VTPLFKKDTLREIIKKTEILIGNNHEIKRIKEKSELNEEEILNFVKAIIITKGPDGSDLIYKDENKNIRSIPIPIATPNKIEDTTGAGDGYRAGVLTGLILNMTLIDSCRLGSTTSSFVVETVGAQTQNFNLEQVKMRFFKTFGFNPPEFKGIH